VSNVPTIATFRVFLFCVLTSCTETVYCEIT